MAVLEKLAAVAGKQVTVEAESLNKGLENLKGNLEGKLKEIEKGQVENVKSYGDAVLLKLDEIKNLTPEQLKEKMNESLGNYNSEGASGPDEGDGKQEGLTDEEKKKIKEETGWPDEVIDAIGSFEEYRVYKDAGLVESEINGKKCLIRDDIDWEQKDAMGRTNKERAQQGLSPINKEGKVIELLHIGQHAGSPLAELKTEEHRGKGNDAVLHNKSKETEIDRQVFQTERAGHWQARANEGGN